MKLFTRSLCTSLLAPAAAFFIAPSALAQISFTQGPSVPTGARADGPAFADFDGDGNMDLAVVTDGTGSQDLLELFRGDGTGAFTPAGVVVLPNSSSPKDIAVALIDGDLAPDIAVILEDSNQVVVARNLGAFAFAVGPGVASGGIEARIIETADMDGDGDADFVVSSRDSNNVSVLLNTAGTLSLAGTANAGDEPRDIALGDWNGDGLIDVAAAAHDSRQVVILMGLGGGALGAGQTLSVPSGTRPSGMAAADMDGDGDLDVLAGTGDDNNAFQNFVSIYTNSGGVFSGPTSYTTGGLDAGDLLVGDFDLDGDNDVAVAHDSSASIAFLENAGNGTFGAPSLVPFGGLADTFAGGDIDGNGSIDFGVTRRQASGVSIFLNDSAGMGGPIGSNYCMANVNSSGASAAMSATGSASVSANDLTVGSTSLPTSTVGYFIVSRSSGFFANPSGSAGNLCLAGQVGRYSNSVLNSGAAGGITLAIDLTQIQTPSGAVMGIAGETWYFQSWFRDMAFGTPTSNFSDGYAIVLN